MTTPHTSSANDASTEPAPALVAAHLVQFLEQSVQVRSALLQSWHRTGHIAERVVLDHGGLPSRGLGIPVTTTPTLGPGMMHGQARMCFANAQRSMTADLLYTEGWAAAHGAAGVPIHHAWLTTRDGQIYDPTWAREFADSPTHYLGIRFSPAFMHQHHTGWGTSTVLEAMRLLEQGLTFDVEHVATAYADDTRHTTTPRSNEN